MATTHTEFNKYHQLKTKISSTKSNLFFLEECKKHHLIPGFIQISIKTKNSRTERVLNFAKSKWLKCEMEFWHAKLQRLELESYRLYHQITANLPSNEWDIFDRRIHDVIVHKTATKMSKIDKKLSFLKQKYGCQNKNKNGSQIVPDLVHNLSSTRFTNEEMDLLNKGLNFAIPSRSLPIKDLIVDLETNIKKLSPARKEVIREISRETLKKDQHNRADGPQSKYDNVLKSLKEKNVAYIKADKSNAVVILDKEEYDSRMLNLITTGPYVEVKNPLNKMCTVANSLIRKYDDLFPWIWKKQMKVANPRVPCIYGQPKIHKPGNKMRPITSDLYSPLNKTAKWLAESFGKLKKPEGFSVENSYELINDLKDQRIETDEMLVSFDITSFYPSVPVDDALKSLNDWLDPKQVDHLTKDAFKELTAACMNQNYFEFRGKFYKQTSGTAMGNSLSPLVCNIYASEQEVKMSTHQWFPRFWRRYVDDVVAIVKKNKLDETLNHLNNFSPHLQYTCEVENDGKLPFLDIIISREADKLDFNIYRKPTSTSRLIPIESNHHPSQKYAAFNSMVHRLVNFPLSKESYTTELAHIKNMAKINGYTDDSIDILVKRHTHRLNLKNTTTLTPISDDRKWCSFTYCPDNFHSFQKIFKKENISLAPSSRKNKIRNLLGSVKDQPLPIEKSGIYIAKCGTKNCKAEYIGQTKRNVKVRSREHLYYIKCEEGWRSGITDHILSTGHHITRENFSLLDSVTNERHLDVLESIHIHKHHPNHVNKDNGPLSSSLFELL